jgi:hypothetical protein
MSKTIKTRVLEAASKNGGVFDKKVAKRTFKKYAALGTVSLNNTVLRTARQLSYDGLFNRVGRVEYTLTTAGSNYMKNSK